MPTPQPLPPPTPYRHSEVDTSDRLPAGTERRPMFIYAHFWQSWMYVEVADSGAIVEAAEHGKGKGAGEWLPALTKVPIVKGSGGAHNDRDVQAAVRRVADKGGQVFLPHDRRLGRWADYLQVYRDMGGGLHFAELSEVATRLPGGGVKFGPGDRKDYVAMLRHVRDNGVEPMAPQAYDAIRARMAAEVERLRELSITSGRGAPQLEIKERVLAAWDQAWEREQARAAAAVTTAEPAVAAAMPADVDWTAAEAMARTRKPRRVQPAQTEG